MNSTVMLEGHQAATGERIKQSAGEYVLVAQDTSYYNYTSHYAMEGLGKIQGTLSGVMQHNLLALSESGIPLGLLGQEYWSRHSEYAYQGKESQRWLKGLETVNRQCAGIDKKVVLIQDREADIYEFFQAERDTQVELIVRVHEPRRMEIGESGEVCRLDEIGEKLPMVGEKQVEIMRDSQEIKLVLAIRAAAVNVLAGQNKVMTKRETEGLSLVIAEERAAYDQNGKKMSPAGEPVVWYLLTSLKIDEMEQIERVIDFYALRWRIERLHYTLKSGALEVEKMQFDDLETTINALTFYSIVAWQILAIAYLLRAETDSAAGACFEDQELILLEKVSGKRLKTVKEAALALTKLAGFAPSKRQPMPGIKVLAQSLERFHYIKMGFEAKPT